MDNTISQIAFDFAAGTASEPAVTPKEDQPVNVGIRLKALKPVPATEEKVNMPVEPLLLHPATAAPDIIEFTPREASPKPLPVKSTRGRKSIRQTAAEADLIQIPEDEILFQKQYYSMGEVAEMFRVNHSLLRFWENEFDIIQPRKNRKGDRHFRPIDIKNLHLIYHLLRQRKYTIEGAKDFLKKNKKAEEHFEVIRKLEQIRTFILELKASL